MDLPLTEKDFLTCCASTKFAAEMAKTGSYSSLPEALELSREIWWNKVDIPGWLEAFAAHPKIGDVESLSKRKEATAGWSKAEQSTAMSTASDSTLQELAEWNRRYEGKFGCVFLICASGRSTPEILDALKIDIIIHPHFNYDIGACYKATLLDARHMNWENAIVCQFKGQLDKDALCIVQPNFSKRFTNRPIVELEVAAGEQQKITELRLAKLFADKGKCITEMVTVSNKIESLQSTGSLIADRRLNQIGAHLSCSGGGLEHPPQYPSPRTRPPITTHVLDVSHGRPGVGIEVLLQFGNGITAVAGTFPDLRETVDWTILGSSITNDDGRCGPLMPVMEHVPAGIYRLTFNTGKYFTKMGAEIQGNELRTGFYPYISVVFEIKPSQTLEHFHVPVILSPFSFTTYRGS